MQDEWDETIPDASEGSVAALDDGSVAWGDPEHSTARGKSVHCWQALLFAALPFATSLSQPPQKKYVLIAPNHSLES